MGGNPGLIPGPEILLLAQVQFWIEMDLVDRPDRHDSVLQEMGRPD